MNVSLLTASSEENVLIARTQSQRRQGIRCEVEISNDPGCLNIQQRSEAIVCSR